MYKPLQRLIPVFAACLVLAAIILIVFTIIGYGYLPFDDALRHAAKVISGKAWNEILVMRDDIKIDHHIGWHAILGFVHNITGCDQDGLVVFSVAALFIAFCVIPVFFLSYPEAWLITLLITAIVNFVWVQRLFFGRPYIITESTILILCFVWQKLRSEKIPYRVMGLLILLIALSVWTHGIWYLFILPIVCFFLAREWRAGLHLSIATICGIILGAFFTGHPCLFLKDAVIHMMGVFGNNIPNKVLVAELQPFGGEVLMVMVVCGLLVWRYIRGRWNAGCVYNPIFILSVCGWVLGFYVGRFWTDWGLVALMAWITLEFQDFFKGAVEIFSWRRIWITAAVAITLFLALTNDSAGRWTYSCDTEYLSQDDPKQASWLPEPGGIIYSDDMTIFFQTFFRNPKAPWRYILGFEAGLMPPEDLAVLRNIQLYGSNVGGDALFKPWVAKMRPQDRLILKRPASQPPGISGLKWEYVGTNIWIGRLPKTSDNKRSH